MWVGWGVQDLAAFARVFGAELVPVNSEGAVVQLYISQGRNPGQTPARGSDFWHSDNSYKSAPASATVLYALELPPPTPSTPSSMKEEEESSSSGAPTTMLTDASLAFDSLPCDMRARVENLTGEHVSDHNAGAVGGGGGGGHGGEDESGRRLVAVHPVVRRHPETGRASLYVNPLYTKRLLGPNGEAIEDGMELLAALFRHMLGPATATTGEEEEDEKAGRSGGGEATATPWEEGGLYRSGEGAFGACFEWRQPGDLLIWDNARMLHRATTLEGLARGSKRRMLRCNVKGVAPAGVFRQVIDK